MTNSSDSITEPIPISLIAGRYLLFDINVVTYLRRTHHICGVLIGSIPQIPQQNVFLGLPVELLQEEAKWLVDHRVAYVVDDAAWHRQKLSSLQGPDRKKYLESLRTEGHKARKSAEDESQKRTERGLAKQALLRREKTLPIARSTIEEPKSEEMGEDITGDDPDTSLFDSAQSGSAVASPSSPLADPYPVTSTTSHAPLVPSSNVGQHLIPAAQSYPLFAHLHAREYFITPGLRFGCDYTVYPGDPLRFHSHFLAVGYGWDQEIPLLDLIGGGRLGTGVKKGFLIGGQDHKDHTAQDGKAGRVRTFCIEWGGM